MCEFFFGVGGLFLERSLFRAGGEGVNSVCGSNVFGRHRPAQNAFAITSGTWCGNHFVVPSWTQNVSGPNTDSQILKITSVSEGTLS